MKTRKIAVGVDFSDEAKTAVNTAAGLAKQLGAELVLIHIGPVAMPAPPSILPSVREWERVINQQAAESRKFMQTLVEETAKTGIEVSSCIVEGDAAEELAKAADDKGADLLIVGTHGRGGAKRFLLGSVAERVVRVSTADVLVVRAGEKATLPPARILLATDFSTHAEAALRAAIDLAKDDATIDIVHFWDVSPVIGAEVGVATIMELGTEMTADAKKRGDALMEAYRGQGVTLSFESVQGRAALGIIDKEKDANEPYDLVVVGSHGRRGFKRLVLGSVAEKVVRHVSCSALVVHRDEDREG